MNKETIKLYNEFNNSKFKYEIINIMVLDEVCDFLSLDFDDEIEIEVTENNILIVANEVKRQYLKYDDVAIDYNTIRSVIYELIERGEL